jgi:UDP-N-acetylmuramyl pentapeptide synthase
MHRVTTSLRRLVAKGLESRVQKLMRQHRPKLVAVTGSVGKTSTKLAIAEVLRQKYRVLVHEGNYNVDVSVPLVFFELDPPRPVTDIMAWMRLFRTIDRRLRQPYPYDVVVLELGADHVGEIQAFMKYLHPDIGVVTAIAPAHLEQFGSIQNIAREKMSLAEGSRLALLNVDDKRVKDEGQRLSAQVATYGLQHGEVHFSDLDRSQEGALKGKLHLKQRNVDVQTNFLGEHSLPALSAAAAVAAELGLGPQEIATGIAGVRPFAGRMNPLAGKNGSLIIDDTYNSSPEAAIAALQTLYDLPGQRKIAILGSMNELGDFAKSAHQEVGEAASKLDMLLTIGYQAADWLAPAAARAGLTASQIHNFDSPYEAGRFLAPKLKKGVVLLAKGSQNGVFAEEAVALLLADPADRSKLVRQEPQWQTQKTQQFELQ